MAIQTELGLVLAGAVTRTFPKVMVTRKALSLEDQDLNEQFRNFCLIEQIGNSGVDSKLTHEEQLACDLMEKVTKYDDQECRWTTGLLWKVEHPSEFLESNWQRAVAVARSIIRKYSKNRNDSEDKALEKKNIMNGIQDAYEKLLQDGSAEPAPVPEEGKFVHYISTFPIIKPEAKSTKVRICLNAKEKDKISGKSINDLLYQGPNEIPNLCKEILKMRKHRYLAILDVSKMFLTIGLNEEDRDAVRFVWIPRGKTEPQAFRFKAVAFGLKPSPFQSQWVRIQQAKKCQEEFPNGAKIILENCYVDDLHCGHETIKGCNRQVMEVDLILGKANMHTHKMATNHPDVLEFIEAERKAAGDEHKLLGVSWNTKEDVIYIELDILDEIQKVTRRIMLKIVAQVFDPIGLLQPFILKGKMMIAETWDLQLEWDDEVPEELAMRFRTWHSSYKAINRHKVKRQYPVNSALTIFCDASKDAYGVVAYLHNSSETSIVYAKSKVASKDAKAKADNTIPRLELKAAEAAAEANEFICSALDLDPKQTICFSDSTITLHRIAKGADVWKQWIANRIIEILKRTSKDNWKYVDTAQNPADLASRGCNGDDLKDSEIWWSGPRFMNQDSSAWPYTPCLDLSRMKPENLEYKTDMVMIAHTSEVMDTWITRLAERVGKLHKILGTMYQVIRFTEMVAPGAKNTPDYLKLSPARIRQWCMEMLITTAQWQVYGDQIRMLKKKEHMNGQLEKLDVFLDDNGMMRVMTRLPHDEEPNAYDTAKPLLLPKHNTITERIVMAEHAKLYHQGFEHLLANLRRKYWIIGSRREIKRIIAKCKDRRCRKIELKHQRMADLPMERLKERPWTFISIDYWGPMEVKNAKVTKEFMEDEGEAWPPANLDGKKSKKRRRIINGFTTKVWGFVATCFATRAVHVEVVDSLSTKAFLEAFRRFTARRGLPSRCWSDNAKNFRAGGKELTAIIKSIDWSEVQQDLNQFEWIFTCAEAPHTNGVVERIIGIFKTALKAAIGSRRLTLREFETICIEIEGQVNSRPLYTKPSEDGPIAVTPHELLAGRALAALPMALINQGEIEKRKGFIADFKARSQILKSFRKTFYNQYLLALGPRRKWKNVRVNDIKVNDIVLIRSQEQPHRHWELGRVLELILGRDKLPRKVKLIKGNGQMIIRSIGHVSLLEAAAEGGGGQEEEKKQ